MRYMPDSAIAGTIGHARRRNAIARKRNARRNARIANQRWTATDIVGGIVLMIGFVIVVGLFL